MVSNKIFRLLSVSFLMFGLAFIGFGQVKTKFGTALDSQTSAAKGSELKGAALLVGLQRVDDNAYKKKYNKTYSPVATAGALNDIQNIKQIINDQPYSITELVNEQATDANMFSQMRRIGKSLSKDDIFLLYFSGHGDEVKDISGDEGAYGKDQVYVAYNDYALDDSIRAILSKYFAQTRNVMVIDACHSSSLYQLFIDFTALRIDNNRFVEYQGKIARQAASNESCNYDQTTDIQQPFQLIYYGAAADSDTAGGTASGGKLTLTLKDVYDEEMYTGQWQNDTYKDYACKIGTKMPNTQRLQFHELGPPKDEFKINQPFKIKLK